MLGFGKGKKTGKAPRTCPGCGCELENHGWNNCPRCHHELPGCSGCGNCSCS